ncbi:MAG TPA: hypothetical protein VMJ33_03645 [Gallionella sp.]|nr:hypothetical protein [Gallionella sp.]
MGDALRIQAGIRATAFLCFWIRREFVSGLRITTIVQFQMIPDVGNTKFDYSQIQEVTCQQNNMYLYNNDIIFGAFNACTTIDGGPKQ